MDRAAIIDRIDQLLGMDYSEDAIVSSSAAYFGALGLMTSVYGPDSRQVQALVELSGQTGIKSRVSLIPHIKGALLSLKRDIEVGTVGSLTLRGAGASLGDILGLAKEVLEDGGANSKNVGAVLAAAAYEDTLRRMAESFAGVSDRRDLQDVISALKSAGVLQGASIATATGYLKFRNDALHADWTKLDESVVRSIIPFVEALLLKHFSE